MNQSMNQRHSNQQIALYLENLNSNFLNLQNCTSITFRHIRGNIFCAYETEKETEKERMLN